MKDILLTDPDNADLRAYRNFFQEEVKRRSDRLMNYFMAAFFAAGLVFAFYFDTW